MNFEGVLTDFVREKPDILEWGAIPISRSEIETQYKHWVEKDYHGGLQYLERGMDERFSPSLLAQNAHTMLLFSLAYPDSFGLPDREGIKIGAYARGEDYHYRARRYLAELEKRFAEIGKESFSTMRGFVDTSPVLEREWAARAGIGWSGKNCCTIHPKHGSGFLLFGALVPFEIGRGKEIQNFCGTCTACLDACPTDAFVEPGVLDSRKCISFLTIEHKGETPPELAKKFQNWIFGCDICQEVCPWNRKHLGEGEKGHFKISPLDWENLLQKGGGFKSKFKNTPLTRAGRKGMARNLANLANSEQADRGK